MQTTPSKSRVPKIAAGASKFSRNRGPDTGVTRTSTRSLPDALLGRYGRGRDCCGYGLLGRQCQDALLSCGSGSRQGADGKGNKTMTHSLQHQSEILQDRYGFKLAARLSAGSTELPHDLSERLRVARQQAIAHRKVAKAAQTRTASQIVASGRSATLSFGDEGLNLWSRLASALPH